MAFFPNGGISAAQTIPNPTNSAVARSPQTFSLDGMTFENLIHGVPSELKSGYEVMGSVHRLPQSVGKPPKKIIQTFGVFSKDFIEYDCVFVGQNAMSAYRQLIGKLNARRIVELRDGEEVYKGLIWDIGKTKWNRFRQGIHVVFAVIATASGNETQQPAQTTAQQQLQTQLQSIAQIGASTTPATDATVSAPSLATLHQNIATAEFASSFSTSLAAINSAVPFSSQSIATLVGLGAQITSTIAIGQTAFGTLASVTDDSSLLAYNSLLASMNAFQSFLATLQSITGEDGKNAATFAGGDLFTIAAVYLDDAGRMGDLLLVNPTISDPFLAGTTTVNIPRQ